jgi:hypothetical protein
MTGPLGSGEGLGDSSPPAGSLGGLDSWLSEGEGEPSGSVVSLQPAVSATTATMTVASLLARIDVLSGVARISSARDTTGASGSARISWAPNDAGRRAHR